MLRARWAAPRDAPTPGAILPGSNPALAAPGSTPTSPSRPTKAVVPDGSLETEPDTEPGGSRPMGAGETTTTSDGARASRAVGGARAVDRRARARRAVRGEAGRRQHDRAIDYLPASADSTQVAKIQERLPGGETTELVLVYHRDGGLTAADRATAAGQVREIAGAHRAHRRAAEGDSVRGRHDR